jgi:hypothetical protein
MTAFRMLFLPDPSSVGCDRGLLWIRPRGRSLWEYYQSARRAKARINDRRSPQVLINCGGSRSLGDALFRVRAAIKHEAGVRREGIQRSRRTANERFDEGIAPGLPAPKDGWQALVGSAGFRRRACGRSGTHPAAPPKTVGKHPHAVQGASLAP